MKKSIHLFCFFILVISSLSSYSQNSKKAADTGSLHTEYVKVSNEIADLSSRLLIAQNDLPLYQSKMDTVHINAASVNKEQEGKMIKGNTVSAKRNAKIAAHQAKDVMSATHDLNNQHDKIFILASQLSKMQQRLQELDAMHTTL